MYLLLGHHLFLWKARFLNYKIIGGPTSSLLLSELIKIVKAVRQHTDNLALCRFSHDEDVNPNIRSLITVACTLPISSCEAER